VTPFSPPETNRKLTAQNRLVKGPEKPYGKNTNLQLTLNTKKISIYLNKNGFSKILITIKNIGWRILNKFAETGHYKESETRKHNWVKPLVLQRWTRGRGPQ
jgi:hypothetical protein